VHPETVKRKGTGANRDSQAENYSTGNVEGGREVRKRGTLINTWILGIVQAPSPSWGEYGKRWNNGVAAGKHAGNLL